MGAQFPYLDEKEVYDLLISGSSEWLLLHTLPLPALLAKMKRRYRHVHTLGELIDTGRLFPLLAESTSILRKSPQTEASGLMTALLITYRLQALSHVDKTRFGYALRGRKKGEGLLLMLGARMVGRNALIVPTTQFSRIKEFLDGWKAVFTAETIYLQKTEKARFVDNQQKQ